MIRIISLVAAMMAGIMNAEAQELDKENTLYIELEAGRIVIAMRPDKAPNHVARVKELARQKYYDGVVFHRVIPNFVAQGGDPSGTGAGGTGQNIAAEFSDLPHLRGTVSMARADDPDSADSQFFICYTRIPSLDNNYTIWGRVIGGMDVADSIAVGEPPLEPTRMISVRVAADVDE